MIEDDVFEGYYETVGGLIFVQSQILKLADEIVFNDLSFYPTGSTKLQMSVGEGTRIFHAIMEEARELGFAYCTVKAIRTGGANPGRMLILTRRLR